MTEQHISLTSKHEHEADFPTISTASAVARVTFLHMPQMNGAHCQRDKLLQTRFYI